MKIFKNILEIVGKILLAIVISFLLAAMISITFSWLFHDILWVTKSLPFIQNICFIVAVVLMYVWFERKRGWHLGWIQNSKWKSWFAGSVWGIIMITSAFLVIWLLGGLKIVGVSFDLNIIQSLVYSIFFFLLVAINEELMSRGYLQGLIRRHFGAATGVVATSLLFAAMHLMNENVLEGFVPLINLFLAGMMFGIAREVTGGLWLPIGIHFTWNLFQGSLFGFHVSGMNIQESIIHIEVVGNGLISGGEFGAEGSLITSLVLIISTIMIWFWYRKQATVKKNKFEIQLG
jgi:membrane protease YdiL (CAAX protease family)